MTGNLTLIAERRGERTRLACVRYNGTLRCSRAFDDRGAVRVVTSSLGPGLLAGDRTVISGNVGTQAHLIVTEQSATRAYGGAAISTSHRTWNVASAATLELLAEPVTLFSGSRHEANMTIELEVGARVTIVDAIVAAESHFVSYASDVTIHRAGRLVTVDRARLDSEAMPARALGVLIYLGHLSEYRLAEIESLLHAIRGIRFGIGQPLAEGLIVRLYGDDAWTVREALHAVAARVRCSTSVGQSQDEIGAPSSNS